MSKLTTDDLIELRVLLSRSLRMVEQALEAMQEKDEFVFDPGWKTEASGGRQFTQKGVDALYAMFKAGYSNSRVAKTSRVASSAIVKYRKMYESGNWGRTKPTQLTRQS